MEYPVIDMEKTGEKIKRICLRKGITAREIKEYMGFTNTQSVYDWFKGKTLPSLDNFYALAKLLCVSMKRLIVSSGQMQRNMHDTLYVMLNGLIFYVECQKVKEHRTHLNAYRDYLKKYQMI